MPRAASALTGKILYAEGKPIYPIGWHDLFVRGPNGLKAHRVNAYVANASSEKLFTAFDVLLGRDYLFSESGGRNIDADEAFSESQVQGSSLSNPIVIEEATDRFSQNLEKFLSYGASRNPPIGSTHHYSTDVPALVAPASSFSLAYSTGIPSLADLDLALASSVPPAYSSPGTKDDLPELEE